MRILIVEDDAIARQILKSILAPYGECELAANGEEAVAIFKRGLEVRRPFIFVCMDIIMPKMDGQLALKAIRAEEAQRGIGEANRAKVLLLTSLEGPDVYIDEQDTSVSYVNKPIDGEKILAEIKKFGLTS